MITAVILGVLIGVSLGALGGGGSILTVPVLVYVLAQPLQTAVTESLIIVGLTSSVAMLAHARGGRVKWLTGAILGTIGGIAAWAGTNLARTVEPRIALGGFAVLMVVVSISLLYRVRAPKRIIQKQPALAASSAPSDLHRGLEISLGPKNEDSSSRGEGRSFLTGLKVVLAGILLGLLTGFFGVGGGFVIVPVLVLALGYPMPMAVGTSLLVITLNSGVALFSRIGHGELHWHIIVPVTLAAIAGSMAGKRLAQAVDEKILTRAFAVLLLLVAAYVGAQSSGILPH